MKKIIPILLILSIFCLSKDFKNINLNDFVQILSHTTQKNFVISDSVSKDFHIFLPNYDFTNKNISIKLLNNILKLNNLAFKHSDNVYLIYKPAPPAPVVKSPIPLVSNFIKYYFLNKNDIVQFFTLYPKIKYSILKSRIFITSTKKQFDLISKSIHLLDSSYLQKRIKITVISTSNNKLRNVGADFKALHFSTKSYINLITSSANFNTTLSNVDQFYAFLNLSNSLGYTKLLLNPSILLTDSKDSIIESTTNIPFLSSTTTTRDTTSKTENSYKYRDVGLKIKFTNVSITPKNISFDLDLNIQNILDQSITPVTTSKHINTHIVLDSNSTVFIGGLNSTDSYKTVTNIPVIDYIPLINKITEHTNTKLKNETYSIIFSTD